MLTLFLFLRAAALLAFLLPVEAYPRVFPRQTNTTGTPCYQIFSSDDVLFLASDAYDCLITAPFNATVASGLLTYYKDFLQFQSTLAYLKDPPPSYQQPSIDVLASFDALEGQVQAGTFKTEYDFEVALQTLIYAIHDAHVSLSAGVLSIFTFGSPLRIVAVSSNGIELPKIYIPDDLIEAAQNDVTWTPSALSSINGQDPIDYLNQFAATNAGGTIEPNADWNQLMSNPVGDVLNVLSAFEGSTIFYPGANISFVFENGTNYENLPWLAGYSDNVDADTPALSSGQDLYDYFVLGVIPTDIPAAASSSVSAAASSTSAAAATSSTGSPSDDGPGVTPTPTPSASATPSSWSYAPFPSNPVVAQPNLGLQNGGVVTGYFLNDGITAVLSIPSFEVTGEAALSFSSTIGNFISQTKAAGLTRIIIDLQRNQGGSDLLAIDAFKQFFPSTDAFNGARLRANDFGDALGNTFTTYFNTQQLNESFYDALSADIWVASVYLNAATGANFTSWPEFFGPHPDHGDLFTTIQRDNLSNIIFDENASDDSDSSSGIVIYGYGNRSTTSPQPFSADQIILLSDAFCSSSCATFVELMHHQGGARTVVAGGRPELGPMQFASGSRGAQAYFNVDLDADVEVSQILNASITPVPQDSSLIDFYINYAQLNIKDSIRQGEDFPLQFGYEAADCRIFYTTWTVYNFENLWNYVIDAFFRNPELCINGAANETSPIAGTDETGPIPKPSEIPTPTTPGGVADLILKGLQHAKRELIEAKDDLTDALLPPRSVPNTGSSPHDLSTFIDDGTLVNTNVCAACTKNGYACANVPFCSAGVRQTKRQCQRTCSRNSKGICGAGATCFSNSFCLDLKSAAALRLCDSPTQDLKAQQTKAVGGADVTLQYARKSFGLRPP
ncbi:hypothetical protein IMSHALPRED_000535 [Imshaugia aleurites]|uniref:CPAF-like PDZ domain-containing protein n=1 Tax=Imshaugia aleurites TaxID=172621 RepID=A0A8H3G752_9LECA|nr:hypothetical protein IMSHALPRED_000535 [Imshaugia aleurites]